MAEQKNANYKGKDVDSTLDEGFHGADKVPDGGWGWVIVFVCFFSLFVIDGMLCSYGILYPALLDTFQASSALTALPGSLFLGTFLLMGSITSSLIHRFGFKVVTFSGACVAAFGLVCSFLAPNMSMFLLTYGGITGIGIGMVYLPSALMINTYFHKKRGIATGIVTSGGGVGAMSVAPLTEVLVDEYGLRGALLFMAGLVLQICCLALLMRPAPIQMNGDDVPDSSTEHEQYETLYKLNGDARSKKATNGSYLSLHYKQVHPQRVKRDHERTVSLSIDNTGSENCKKRYLSLQELTITDKYIHKKCDSSEIFKQKDISLSGSTNFLQYSISNASIRHESHSKPDLLEDSTGTNHQCSGCEVPLLSNVCRSPVIRNKSFILLVIGSTLTQMANFIPTVFIVDYAQQIGLDGIQISTGFIVYGIMNTCGRLISGVLTNYRVLSPLTTCNLGMVTCAGLLFAFTLYTSFWPLIVFMALFGFFIGFFPATQPLITLQCVGLDNLTLAFGLITMFKAPAAITGPPLAGAIYQLTKSYSVSNAFAGCLCLLAALFQCFIPFCGKSASCPDTCKI